MEKNIFFGGENVILTIKKEATEKQIEILKKCTQKQLCR